MGFEKDPLDVALDIKRNFARVAASRERQPIERIGYAVGVLMWWAVGFAALSIAGVGWLPAALISFALSLLWPHVAHRR